MFSNDAIGRDAAELTLSTAAAIADKQGSVLLYRDGEPKYKLVNLDIEPDLHLTDEEKILVVSRRILDRYKSAYLELAK